MAPPPERWSWLGDPLPVDFANTVRREGSGYREMLVTGADLLDWADREGGRVPRPGRPEADARLAEVRAARDDVFAVLAAAAAGDPFPAAAADRLNARARAVALAPQLGTRAGEAGLVAVGATDPTDELLARVARATVELVAGERAAALALCDAPSCGQFFLRDRPNQHWCGPACGTRARVARHARQIVRPYRPPAPPSAPASGPGRGR
jgi:predicted RNA-binding Zn ribbon-like protein